MFRQGVKPLWEDMENLEGGGWVLKVKKDGDKAVRTWEEICLMGCGGELQAAAQTGMFVFPEVSALDEWLIDCKLTRT